MHVRSSPARKSEGRSPSCCQVCPKSALWAAHVSVPSLTMAVQSAGLAHCTLVTASAFMGAVAGDQVVPASPVVTTTPLPGREAPFEPTAMHSLAVGHETPLNCGVLPPARHAGPSTTSPPLVVATMTVAPVAGGFGPATPTAQHRLAVAHDTAPSSPVPAGAGWPTTRGVPFGSPRTCGLRASSDARPAHSPTPTVATTTRRRVQAATSPGAPVSRHGAWKHGRTTIVVGGDNSWCTVGYPRTGGLGGRADHWADAPGRRPWAAARSAGPAAHLWRVLPRLRARNPGVGAPAQHAATKTSLARSSSCHWSC